MFCSQCSSRIVQATVHDPYLGFEVHQLVCSNMDCVNADPVELEEELYLDKADREYDLTFA